MRSLNTNTNRPTDQPWGCKSGKGGDRTRRKARRKRTEVKRRRRWPREEEEEEVEKEFNGSEEVRGCKDFFSRLGRN